MLCRDSKGKMSASVSVDLRSSSEMRNILPTLNFLFQNFFQEEKAVRMSEKFLLQLL